MMTTQSDRVLCGRGKVFFDRFTTAGVSTGYSFLGTVSKLELKINDDKAQIFDYSEAAAGLLNEVMVKREATLDLTLHEYTKENLALALMGAGTTFTQSSSTVTDESMTTSVVKGHSYQTAGRNISGVTVKKSPSTALVLGTDYDIADATTGLIHIKESGVTLTDGDTVLVTYTKAAITGLERVQGGTAAQILGKLLFTGDPAAGPSMDVEVWRVSLNPSGVLGFITGGDFGSFDLSGNILADKTNHPTEPYFRTTKRT